VIVLEAPPKAPRESRARDRPRVQPPRPEPPRPKKLSPAEFVPLVPGHFDVHCPVCHHVLLLRYVRRQYCFCCDCPGYRADEGS
jgi:hypothetical protein